MDTIRIKQLMITYGQDPTEDNFKSLLREVDPHLLVCVRVLRSKFPILLIEDPQDLYQCAIIGLSKACKTLTVEHDAKRMDTRIYFYTKEEVSSIYLRPHRDKYKLHKAIEQGACDETPVWSCLLFNDFEEAVKRLIQRGVIDFRDYAMFVQHYAHKRTYPELHEIFHLHPDTIRTHVVNVLNVLRATLQKEDFVV